MEPFQGEGLCFECIPEGTTFSDGSVSKLNMGEYGKWHNKFPKQSIDDFMKSESGRYYRRNGYELIYIGE